MESIWMDVYSSHYPQRTTWLGRHSLHHWWRDVVLQCLMCWTSSQIAHLLDLPDGKTHTYSVFYCLSENLIGLCCSLYICPDSQFFFFWQSILCKHLRVHFKELYPDHVMFFHYFKVGFQRLEETYVIFLHDNIVKGIHFYWWHSTKRKNIKGHQIVHQHSRTDGCLHLR